MVDLCGRAAFPFPQDIPAGARYPNNGIWVPHSWKKIGLRPKAELRRAIKEALEEEGVSLNRAARRGMPIENQLADMPDKKVLDLLMVGDRSHNPLIMSIAQTAMVDFIKGKLTERQLNFRLFSWMSNPENYALVLRVAGVEKGNAIREFLGETSNEMFCAVTALRDCYAEIRVKRRVLVESRKILDCDLRSQGLDASARDSLLPVVPNIPDVPSLNTEGEIWEIFGKGRLRHFEVYFSQAVKGLAKLAVSDFADMLHLVYAYDCDLLRCDRATYRTFENYAPFQGRLVPSLLELPDRIERIRQG